jgi:hypothetical protein
MKRKSTSAAVSPINRRCDNPVESAVDSVSEISLQTAFAFELNPRGTVETFLVQELSRRASHGLTCDAALHALCHQGEAAFSKVLSGAGKPENAPLLARATVAASERYESLMRQSTAAGRAFVRTLHEYREFRAHNAANFAITARDPRFTTEPDCVAHLVRRYVLGCCACRRCGSVANGNFIAARTCWQCAACHAQTGLRVGTCMEHSSVPLATWFAAIRIVLLNPGIGAEELATALKLNRRQTVRSIIRRVRTALESDQSSGALAGLDKLYFGSGRIS